MYFLYKKQILTKLNFKPILQFGSNNRVLTIQLFGLTIRIVRIVFRTQKMNEYEYEYRIPNTTIWS